MIWVAIPAVSVALTEEPDQLFSSHGKLLPRLLASLQRLAFFCDRHGIPVTLVYVYYRLLLCTIWDFEICCTVGLPRLPLLRQISGFKSYHSVLFAFSSRSVSAAALVVSGWTELSLFCIQGRVMPGGYLFLEWLCVFLLLLSFTLLCLPSVPKWCHRIRTLICCLFTSMWNLL